MKATAIFFIAFVSFTVYSQPHFKERVLASGFIDWVEAVHAADIDGDGITDILSIDGSSISYFRSHGDGTFDLASVVSWRLFDGMDVQTADFDADGDLDIVGTCDAGQRTSWFENLGNGQFSLEHLLDDKPVGVSLQVGDMDGDGDPDIVSSNGSSNILWYKNLGNGEFSSRIILDTYTDVQEIILTDIDNDGDLDLMCHNDTNYEVRLYKNNGAGTFTSQGSVIASGSITRKIALTDADGDGDMDLVTGSIPGTRLYRNDGTGIFDAGVLIYSSNSSWGGLESADIDNDGDQDLVYARNSNYGHEIGYLRNNGGGTSYTWVSNIDLHNMIFDIVVLDIDGDGLKDVVSASTGENKIGVYRNLGEDISDPDEYLFAQRYHISSQLQNYIYCSTAIDYDADGDMDIMACNREAGNADPTPEDTRLVVYKNDGSGNFSQQNIIGNDYHVPDFRKFRMGDVDGDGDLDAVAYTVTDQQILWYANTGGPLLSYTDHPISVYYQEVIEDFDLGDMDGDGDQDVAAVLKGDFNYRYVIWYQNNGGGNFAARQLVDPTGIVAGLGIVSLNDIDGDGLKDVLYDLQSDDRIQWYRSLGGGAFSAPMVLTTTLADANDALAADMDQDGLKDILAVERWGTKLVMYKQLPGATFTSEIVIDNTLEDPYGLTVGDLNGDGLKDIIVGNDGMAWYRNLGGGTFAPRIEVGEQTPSTVMLVGPVVDFNGDGANDILFAHTERARIGWMENIGTDCPDLMTVLDDTICFGDSYAFNGMNLTEPGVYEAAFLTSQLCDSTVVLNLRWRTVGCPDIACAEVYMSEYIHGTGSNRAIELYNPTDDPIDLGTYSIRIYSNGLPSYSSFPLTGTIAANGTFVIAHPSAAAGILTHAGQTNTLLNYTGDDAIELVRGFNRIDLIGQIGVDPGTSWDSGTGVATAGKTLIRKPAITSGLKTNAMWYILNHFTALSQNNFTNLGQHTTTCQSLLCNTNSDLDLTICSDDTYLFAGQPRTAPGIYYDTLTNSTGCDSIVRLDLTAAPSLAIVHETTCSNTGYPFNSGTLYTSGIYFDTLPGLLGCDSIVKLTLTVKPAATRTLSQTLCFGESIIVNGNSYSGNITGATEVHAGAAANGCDSIVTINLTTRPQVTATQNHNVCNAFTWINGVTYTSDATATHVIPNGSATGCDSTVYLNLTVHHSSSATDTRTECQSYTWINGTTYTSNATAVHTITGGNAHGCDSTLTLNLTIIPAATGIDTRTECQSYTWINGTTYTASNHTATHVLSNAAMSGCDSIVTLDLTILPAATGTDPQTSCTPITWINGVTYTASNSTATYTYAGGASSGCDSIVTLHFTLLPQTTGTDIQSDCEPLTWIDGITYTASNSTATFTYENGAANGCDSVVTLNFTLLSATEGTDVIYSCQPYTWINGVTYSADNNTADFTLVNASGCDSIVHLDLTVGELNTNVSVDTNTLTAVLSGADYQWIDCATGAAVAGATGQTFVAAEIGSYAVVLTTPDCTDTSDCVAVTAIVGLEEGPGSSAVVLFPNPTTDVATVRFSETVSVAVLVFDQAGKCVYETTCDNAQQVTFPTKELAPGMYTVRLSGGVAANLRFVKM